MTGLAGQSRWLAWLTGAVMAALGLALVVELAAVAQGNEVGRGMQWMLILRLPLACYLPALWMMRRTFAELARGALIEAVAPRLMRWVGIALAAGATAQVFAMPLLMRWSFATGRGPYANYDPSAITLGVVGLMLVVVAGLFEQAAAMRAELDGFV